MLFQSVTPCIEMVILNKLVVVVVVFVVVALGVVVLYSAVLCAK